MTSVSFDPSLLKYLRPVERDMLGERQSLEDEMAVETLRKLAQTRRGLELTHEDYESNVGTYDWQQAYERACDAIERLLRRIDHAELMGGDATAALAKAKATVHSMDRELYRLRQQDEELARVREQRDEAMQNARDAFARGRRSADRVRAA